MKRNYILDKYRAFTIISMVLFHLLYDINLYTRVGWYDGTLLNRIWQISIAGSFFIISGISSNFLDWSENIKRGIKISFLGIMITVITYLFDKNLLIIFGVLNGLGLSMIITGFLQKYIKTNYKFSIIFLILFIITYTIPNGRFFNIELSNTLYSLNIFPLGFPSERFYSTDYFPLIPWLFIYLFGFYLGKYFIDNNFFGYYGKNTLMAKIGQHSIVIYLLHQIIIYIIVDIFFTYLI